MKRLNVSTLIVIAFLFLAACGGGEVSDTTGWEYNNPDNGGFEVSTTQEQATGPGLILIEGGAFTMGQVEQDVMYDWNNMPRRITIPSFYMDETEISNVDYREYLYWIRRVFGQADMWQVYVDALPDTLVWRSRLAYNEPYVEYYFRHPSYNNYPVVGVSWVQADKYCTWRTDRVNEQILINEGFLVHDPNQVGENNFNTEAYYAGLYEGQVKNKMKSLNPNQEDRNVRMEDGILLPRYQLPTEAQWEYAALGLIGNSIDERIFSRKLYPWNGHYLRNDTKENMGMFMANFQRGRGDMMGVAGYLNDNAAITSEVDAYWPNDYGLYCMAGNVNEWVRDVYRPMSSMDVDGFRPFRGNVFKSVVLDKAAGEVFGTPKLDSLGQVVMQDVTEQETMGRDNYKKADNINYLDGDLKSRVVVDWNLEADEEGSKGMYNYGVTSLVNDESRVYKGGSWKDRPYWLVPGTRRFMNQNKATADIGFRCSMIRVGSTTGF